MGIVKGSIFILIYTHFLFQPDFFRNTFREAGIPLKQRLTQRLGYHVAEEWLQR